MAGTMQPEGILQMWYFPHRGLSGLNLDYMLVVWFDLANGRNGDQLSPFLETANLYLGQRLFVDFHWCQCRLGLPLFGVAMSLLDK